MDDNKENANNELLYFVKKVGIRFILLASFLILVFALPLSRNYFFSSMEKTIHSKLSWVWRKLNNTHDLDNTIVFVGSSVCFYGIEDSLLTATDTTGIDYLNLGVVHHCNDITDVVLQEMIVARGLKPKRVILCLKSDAFARDVHHMFPLAATQREITHTLVLGNSQFIPTFLKRAAWNSNYLTGHFKMDTGEDSLYFSGNYGFEPQPAVDSLTMEKKYQAQRDGMESVFRYLQSESLQSGAGLKVGLLAAKRNIIDNEKFQSRMFEKSAALLQENNIPFDILIYPNFAASRAGMEDAMAGYARKHLSQIDFDQHEIIVISDKRLSEANSWVDMNHLSPTGAAIFSERVREYLLVHP